MFIDRSPAFLVLGYGATRRVAPDRENLASREKHAHLRFQRVQGLFEEGVSLIPLSRWLPAIPNAGRRKQVVQLIDLLIGEFYKFDGETDASGELLFRRETAKVPFGGLSDGFRAYLAWVGDMLYHIYTGCPSGKKLNENEGVVLVDEIDLHLHPDWQRVVIRKLSQNFPRIQFIFTSHSPLVTGSLEWSNIWVMSDNGPRQLPDEPIYGLSADQVLQSPYFNLDSTRAPEVVDALRKLDLKRKAAMKRRRWNSCSGWPTAAKHAFITAGKRWPQSCKIAARFQIQVAEPENVALIGESGRDNDFIPIHQRSIGRVVCCRRFAKNAKDAVAGKIQTPHAQPPRQTTKENHVRMERDQKHLHNPPAWQVCLLRAAVG